MLCQWNDGRKSLEVPWRTSSFCGRFLSLSSATVLFGVMLHSAEISVRLACTQVYLQDECPVRLQSGAGT